MISDQYRLAPNRSMTFMPGRNPRKFRTSSGLRDFVQLDVIGRAGRRCDRCGHRLGDGLGGDGCGDQCQRQSGELEATHGGHSSLVRNLFIIAEPSRQPRLNPLRPESFRLACGIHLPREGYFHGHDRRTACGSQSVRAQILLADGAVSRLPRAARLRAELLSAGGCAVLSAAEPDASTGGHSPRDGFHDLDGADHRANAADRGAQARGAYAPRQSRNAVRDPDDPGHVPDGRLAGRRAPTSHRLPTR